MSSRDVETPMDFVMADPDKEVMLGALSAFADQQYGQCLVTIAGMEPLRDPVFVGLFVICLQRLGLADDILAFTDQVLPRLAGDPRVHGLARLALVDRRA